MGSEYKIPYITTLPETPQNCTKKASEESEAFRFCDPPGDRTLDPNIKSVVLYQLSKRVGTGDPEWIRTPDPQIRNLLLYPAELLDQSRRG